MTRLLPVFAWILTAPLACATDHDEAPADPHDTDHAEDPSTPSTDADGTADTLDPADDDGDGTTAAGDSGDPTDSTDDVTSSGGGIDEPEHLAVFHALCSTCHGHDGEGIAEGLHTGPEIQHAHPLVTAYLVRFGDDNTTTNAMGMPVGHPSTMVPFTTEQVSDAVLADIVDWLQSFPQPDTGDALFADHCSYCHGMTSGSTTEYVSAYHNLPFLTSGATDTLAEFTAYVRAGHVTDDEGAAVPPSARREWMPPFGPELLTDEQLASIEAWARLQ